MHIQPSYRSDEGPGSARPPSCGQSGISSAMYRGLNALSPALTVHRQDRCGLDEEAPRLLAS